MQNKLCHSLTATFEGHTQHTVPDHFPDAGKMIELGKVSLAIKTQCNVPDRLQDDE